VSPWPPDSNQAGACPDLCGIRRCRHGRRRPSSAEPRREGGMTMARSPEEIDAEWSEAFNAGDGEAVLALYEPGAAFVLPTGDVIEGVDNIAQALGGFFAMKPRIDLRTTRVLRSGDTAIVYSLDRHGHGPRRHGRGDVGNADRGPAPAARRNLAVPHRRPGLVRPDRRAVQ